MPIHVLVAADPDLPPALESAWLARLPAARRDQLLRWPDARARQRSLVAHRLLGRALVHVGGSAALLGSLHYTPSGRPRLAAGAADDIAFSLSHCRGRVVCALSTEGPVGIDVEAVDDARGEQFPSYLSAAERAWAGGSARRFYALWTRKEAVAKAAGDDGLAAMRDIDAHAADGRAACGGRLWATRPVPVGRRHVAHVAHVAEIIGLGPAHAAADPVVTIERLTAGAPESIL